MISLSLTYLKIFFMIPNFLVFVSILYFLLKKYNLNIIKFIGGQIVLLFIFIEFYFYGNHNSFEWVTTGDIPIILRLIDYENLKFDFYSNSVMSSPKVIFYYLIYLIYKFFFISLEDILFLFKSIQIFLLPLFAYYILTSFVKTKNIFLISLIFSIIILFCTGYFDFLLFIARIGIDSFTNWKDLSPQTFSFIFGFISLLCYNKQLYRSSILILLFVSLIHIFSGIVFLILFFIIFNNEDNEKNYLFYILNKIVKIKYHLFAVIISIIFINYFFVNKLPQNFFEIYVVERHPHHYLLSSFFNFYSFVFLSLPIIPIIISFYKSKKILFFQSLTILLFFYLCILVQFIGSEILNINFFTLLGPTRFLSISIFLLIYLLIELFNILSEYV